MNFLDLISNYQNDAALPSNPVPPPETYGQGTPQPMSPGAAAAGVPPSVLELLAQIKTPEVQMPKTNPRDALTPALFQFAQAVTAPRRRGQSSSNAILGALNQGMGTYTRVRDAAQDRAMQQEILKRKLQESELGLQRDKIQIAGGMQNLTTREAGEKRAQEEAKRAGEKHRVDMEEAPLRIERANLLIQNAKTDGEIKRAESIITQERARNAKELAQLELDQKRAQTTNARAGLEVKAERLRVERDAIKLAEEALRMKQAEELGRFKGTPIPGDPMTSGTPNRVMIDNKIYFPQHSPAEARNIAEKDAEALDYKRGSNERKNFVAKRMKELMQGTLPTRAKTDAAQPTDTKAPAGQPSAPKGVETPKMLEMRQKSAKEGVATYAKDAAGQMHYYIGGREVTEAEARERTSRAATNPTPDRPVGSMSGMEIGG